MLDWFKTSLLLCFFGFLKEMRPSEVFIIDYLTYPWRAITPEQINKEIWPFGTYLTPVCLLLVLLFTDYLRYKPVIIACGLSGIFSWILLVFTISFEAVMVVQMSYAMFVATEIAYYTYIYAKVDKEHYLKVTSHTRAATLAGKCISGILAQFLIFFEITDLRGLNILTLIMLVIATIWAILLPSVETSLYFNKTVNRSATANGMTMDDQSEPTKSSNAETVEKKNICSSAFELMRFQLVTAYSNRHVLLWSVWYAVCICCFFQVIFYVQILWVSIDNRAEVIWNGAVEACVTLLAALIALLASRVHDSLLKSTRILWALVLFSGLQAGSIFIAANTNSRFISYGGYTMYFILHTFTITISSAQIAKKLPDDSYGLIFGINTFIALVLQSLLTVVVVSETFGTNLNIAEQFNIYAYIYLAMGVLYLVPIKCKLINFDEDISIEPEKYTPNVADKAV